MMDSLTPLFYIKCPDQELLSHEDALDGECEKCEETMPLSSAPPTDVVRSKSGSKGSLSASKGSLSEPKTPDRDLDDHGRKPASRRFAIHIWFWIIIYSYEN